METKDTAVALLKEWKRMTEGNDFLKMQRSEPLLNAHNDFVVVQEISRRLDEKAEAAGITNNGGFLGARNVSRGFGDFEGTFTILAPVCLDLYLPIETKELHAILEWLLIKNEEKTA